MTVDLNKVIKEWHSKMKDDLESKVFSPKEQLLLFFDTETTGLPKNFNLNFYEKSTNWPHLVQLSWIMTDSRGRALSTNDFIIKPDGFVIPGRSTEIHGISHDYAKKCVDKRVKDKDTVKAVNMIIGMSYIGAIGYDLGSKMALKTKFKEYIVNNKIFYSL